MSSVGGVGLSGMIFWALTAMIRKKRRGNNPKKQSGIVPIQHFYSRKNHFPSKMFWKQYYRSWSLHLSIGIYCLKFLNKRGQKPWRNINVISITLLEHFKLLHIWMNGLPWDWLETFCGGGPKSLLVPMRNLYLKKVTVTKNLPQNFDPHFLRVLQSTIHKFLPIYPVALRHPRCFGQEGNTCFCGAIDLGTISYLSMGLVGGGRALCASLLFSRYYLVFMFC